VLSFWPFSKDFQPSSQTSDPNYLGGKGAGLIEVARAGLPVPPGFVIPVDVCREIAEIKDSDTILSAYTLKAVEGVTHFLTQEMGYLPLVSVRSGARVSMPGMMDTLLNVGMTDKTLPLWTQKLGHRAAFDIYRRLIQMYGVTVKGIDVARFKAALKDVMASSYDSEPAKTEAEMSLTHLNKLVQRYLAVYKKQSGEDFPQTLEAQLKGAIGAVFKSWNSERAIAYRIKNNIPHDWYTACVVQAMVFGNANDKSCSGVLFSRDPSTGEKDIKGEFLVNAQGEEVVSGTATPKSLDDMEKWNPSIHTELTFRAVDLENIYKDMVDVEFTVENGKLFILQARVGKRTASAAFKIAYDLVKEEKITKEEALKRLTLEQYQTLNRQVIDPAYKGKPVATGLAGSKGIATGKIWLTKEKAMANPGGILVTKETTPDDYSGMEASVGILTATGGITSHAAVVARTLEKVCVVGCVNLQITSNGSVYFASAPDYDDDIHLDDDAVITIDGTTGHVYLGEVPTIGGKIPEYVQEMIEWGIKPGMVFSYDPTIENLPTAGEVYISLAKLKTDLSVANLIGYLNADRPELHGILSFDGDNPFDDLKFFDTLGIPHGGSKTTLGQIEGLKMFSHPEVKIGQRWTVVGLDIAHANLKGHPFKVHRKAKTLKEFMDTEGYYEIDAALLKVLAEQGLTVDEFAAFLQKAGKNMKPITKPQSRSQLAYTVFGK
jgi:pyruvate, orthophosphate dikinase